MPSLESSLKKSPTVAVELSVTVLTVIPNREGVPILYVKSVTPKSESFASRVAYSPTVM